MSKIKDLMEKRAVAGKEIRSMADKLSAEGRTDFTPEEKTGWDKVNKDFNDLTRSLEIAERADAVDKELGGRKEGAPGSEDTGSKRQKRAAGGTAEEVERAHELALASWCLRTAGKPLTKRHKAACEAVGFNPNKRSFDIQLPRRMGGELRTAQSVGTNSAGGYLRPTGFIHSFEQATKTFDAVLDVADVMRTATGQPLPWPTGDDTGNSGELLAENTEFAEQAITFGATTFNAYKFSSKVVKVSFELLEDEEVGLVDILGGMLGERIGRARAVYHTTGTGSSQPGGIVVGSTLGVTAAGATAITGDEIISLIHSVDPSYRIGAGFMFHDGILAYIRKLKDGGGRYLWEQSTQAGVPDKLLGYPVKINQNMQATVATGTKTMIFGDFKKMKVREVGQVRFKRLDERYAELDQVAFIAFMRSDAKVLDAGQHPIKHLIQA